MTYEEAINCIKANICYKQEHCNDGICKSTENRPCAVDVAIEALEKQITMRATASFAKYYECPKCGELLETLEPYEYCWHCGQRISQSEGE